MEEGFVRSNRSSWITAAFQSFFATKREAAGNRDADGDHPPKKTGHKNGSNDDNGHEYQGRGVDAMQLTGNV